MRSILGAVCLAFALTAPAQAEHLAPRNECSQLEGANKFRMALVTAVANRDADLLEPLVDPQVRFDFGGGSGWEEMRKRLSSDQYRLWKELEAVLRLGCATYDDGSIAMPYYWAQEMPEGFDGFATLIVLGDDVPLYSASEGGHVLRRLDWEAVEMMSFYETREYDEAASRDEVRTADGTRGFVERASLRALVDCRLLARREDGKWRITTFIAGD